MWTIQLHTDRILPGCKPSGVVPTCGIFQDRCRIALSLNPIRLKDGLDRKLTIFFKKSKEMSIARKGEQKHDKVS